MQFSESQAERAALAVTACALAQEAGYDDASIVRNTYNSAVSGLLEDGLISNSTAMQVAGDVEDPLAGHTRVSVRDVEDRARDAPTENSSPGDSGMPALSVNERIEQQEAAGGPTPEAANGDRSDEFPALQVGERIKQRGD